MVRLFKSILLPIFFFFLAPAVLTAQSVMMKGSAKRITLNREIKLISGEIRSIKGIRDITIKFNYLDKRVCSFPNDEAFLSHISKSYSEKKAQQLIQEWKTLPRNQLELRFAETFNKNAADIGLVTTTDTMLSLPSLVIRVLHEDPHFHNGVDGMPPNVSLECTFFDKEGDFLLRFTLTAYGSKEKDLAKRFEECYVIAAKMLARDLTTRMLKYDEQNFRKQ